MPTFHPSEELLLHHASGDLPLARRVLLESHLAFCPACRTAGAELARPGGRYLGSLVQEKAPAALWQKIAHRVAGEMAAPHDFLRDTPLPAAARAELEPARQPLTWSGLPDSPTQLSLLLQDPEQHFELYLIRNPPESSFPYHRHLGYEDLLILQGGLSDAYGHYLAGDLQFYAQGSAHEPRIDAGEICWAITCIQGGVSFER